MVVVVDEEEEEVDDEERGVLGVDRCASPVYVYRPSVNSGFTDRSMTTLAHTISIARFSASSSPLPPAEPSRDAVTHSRIVFVASSTVSFVSSALQKLSAKSG